MRLLANLCSQVETVGEWRYSELHCVCMFWVLPIVIGPYWTFLNLYYLVSACVKNDWITIFSDGYLGSSTYEGRSEVR